MTIEETVSHGVTVLRLGGELDLKSAPALKDRLAAQTSHERPLTVLSLERLTYLDSAGLGVLVGAVKAHTVRAGRLAVAAPRPEVRHIFEITRTTQFIALYPTEEEAVAALAGAP